MMSKASSFLFAFVALQAAWLQPGSLAAASLLPGFAGDASNGSFVEHRLNVWDDGSVRGMRHVPNASDACTGG